MPFLCRVPQGTSGYRVIPIVDWRRMGSGAALFLFSKRGQYGNACKSDIVGDN